MGKNPSTWGRWGRCILLFCWKSEKNGRECVSTPTNKKKKNIWMHPSCTWYFFRISPKCSSPTSLNFSFCSSGNSPSNPAASGSGCRGPRLSKFTRTMKSKTLRRSEPAGSGLFVSRLVSGCDCPKIFKLNMRKHPKAGSPSVSLDNLLTVFHASWGQRLRCEALWLIRLSQKGCARSPLRNLQQR